MGWIQHEPGEPEPLPEPVPMPVPSAPPPPPWEPAPPQFPFPPPPAAAAPSPKAPAAVRRSLAILIPCIIVLLLAGAVGAVTVDDDKAAAGGSGDKGDVHAKLLAVTDLPTGYTAQPSNPATANDPTQDNASSIFCKQLKNGDSPDRAPEHADVSFQKGSSSLVGGTLAAEAIGRYTTKGDAKAVFNRFVTAMRSCKTFDQTDATSTVKGTFSELSFPKLGDQTFAVHLAGEGGTKDFTLPLAVDFVLVRQGRLVMLVATVGFGNNAIAPAELERIVRAGFSKLSK